MSTPPAFGTIGGPAAVPAPLPYAFARTHGVLLLAGGERMAIRRSTKPSAILEARRVAGRSVAVDTLGDEAFDRLLSETYATDGLTAAADAAAATNLATLARDTADLLDNDDASTRWLRKRCSRARPISIWNPATTAWPSASAAMA
jgi:general secretion pathway protein E